MGYMSHNAIVVTCWDGDRLNALRDELVASAADYKMADLITPIVGPGVNGYCSFLIAPDGSKEGWGASDQGDGFRDAAVAAIERWRYEDGSSPFDYVEVQFGNDDRITRLVRDSDHPDGDYGR